VARAGGKLMNKPRCIPAVNSEAARIFADAFTFIGGHGEKHGHQSKWDRAAQIRYRLKR
jgi:hypothetical protein